jgi:pilus assembly protein CpaE
MLLLEQVGQRFDWVVVDLPRHAAGTQREVLTIASDIVLVTDFSLASLRDILRLRELIRLSAPSAKLRVIGCHVTSSKGHLPERDLESGLKSKLDGVIPFDPVSVAKSANSGKPLPLIARNARITAAFKKLIGDLRKASSAASVPKVAE